MSKTYGKKVYDALKENKLKSLLILLEQDEEENTDDDSGSSAEDVVAALEGDDDEESSEESDKKSSEEDNVKDEEMVAALDAKALDDSLKKAKILMNTIEQNQKDPYDSVDSLANAGLEKAAKVALDKAIISPNTNESFSTLEKYYKTKSIGSFINEVDDEKVKKMTDTMSDLEDQLKKYQDTVDNIADGVDIHMPTFVKEAIASFLSFDSKFSKEDIIFKIFSNKLANSSGKKAKENIEEFERLFYKELHKIDDSISREDVIIPVEKTHVAQGATKQG
jgi:hypothetical protein